MVVIFDVIAPVGREHAMARREITPARFDGISVPMSDSGGSRALLQTVVQGTQEVEMTEVLLAEESERTASRLRHGPGDYDRKLVTPGLRVA